MGYFGNGEKINDLKNTLENLFKEGLEVEKAGEIVKSIVEEAKEFADVSNAKEHYLGAKRNYLITLFDSQVNTLRMRGCPSSIVKIIEEQKASVIDMAFSMDIPDSHIPFLPVIPCNCVDLDDLVSMIRNNEKTGCFTASQCIERTTGIPNNPYFIFNVENGKDMLGKSIKEARTLIKEQGRFCLALEEVIALGIHTRVLLTHEVSAAGSPRGSSGNIVYLIIDNEQRPNARITVDYANSSNKIGIPSYRNRS